jgi:hypothetical protein
MPNITDKQFYQTPHLEQLPNFKLITTAISPIIGAIILPDPFEVLD